MKFEFTVTLEDYKAALKLHRRPKLSRRIFPWIGPLLFLISLALFAAGSLTSNQGLLVQAIVLAAWSLLRDYFIPAASIGHDTPGIYANVSADTVRPHKHYRDR